MKMPPLQGAFALLSLSFPRPSLSVGIYCHCPPLAAHNPWAPEMGVICIFTLLPLSSPCLFSLQNNNHPWFQLQIFSNRSYISDI